MSIAAIDTILKAQIKPASRKLVLVALANYADDQWKAWPGTCQLEYDATLSRRALFTQLDELKKLGLIDIRKRRHKNGTQASNLYVLNRTELQKMAHEGDAQCQAEKVKRRQGAADSTQLGGEVEQGADFAPGEGATGCGPQPEQGAADSTSGVRPTAPNPSIEPSFEPFILGGENFTFAYIMDCLDGTANLWDQMKAPTMPGAMRDITPPFVEMLKVFGEQGVGHLTLYFERIRDSEFLSGRSGKWAAPFSWAMDPNNHKKVMAGNYDNSNGRTNEGHKAGCNDPASQFLKAGANHDE